MLTDLHMHTNCSDGTLDPEALVWEALKNGLTTISITDHDVINAYALAQKVVSSQKLPLQIIPGVEINTNSANREVHVLGYHIDTDSGELAKRLKLLQEQRVIRVDKIIKKLNTLGYFINLEDILAVTREVISLGRPHIAKVLINKGYFQNKAEVFDKLLANGAPAYVPHIKLSVQEAVQLINAAGGIAVLAHPGLIKNDELVVELLSDYNFQGIEAYYPLHTPNQVRYYLDLAQKMNLLVSGGSDFHGVQGRYPSSLGIFTISESISHSLINWKNK